MTGINSEKPDATEYLRFFIVNPETELKIEGMYGMSIELSKIPGCDKTDITLYMFVIQHPKAPLGGLGVENWKAESWKAEICGGEGWRVKAP